MKHDTFIRAVRATVGRLHALEARPGTKTPRRVIASWAEKGALHCEKCSIVPVGPFRASLNRRQFGSGSLGDMIDEINNIRQDWLPHREKWQYTNHTVHSCDVLLHLIHLGEALMALLDVNQESVDSLLLQQATSSTVDNQNSGRMS